MPRMTWGEILGALAVVAGFLVFAGLGYVAFLLLVRR
jgi:hypothetical protein